MFSHGLMVNSLVAINTYEMNDNTAPCLQVLYSGKQRETFFINSGFPYVFYDLFGESQLFTQLRDKITTVSFSENGLDRATDLVKVLMSLPNLRHLVLSNITKSRQVLLPFLKLSGNKLKDLHLHGLVGNFSLEDIMNTCKNLQSLTVSQYHGQYLDDSMMDLPIKQQH